MSTTAPTPEAAHNTVLGLHKQAFFGRLQQHGIVPQTEKEAMALLDLSMDLQSSAPTEPETKTASSGYDYGDGPCAQMKAAHDKLQGTEIAPGFAKAGGHFSSLGEPALPNFEPGLVDAAYNAAHELSQNPEIYGAAVIKRAENEKVVAEMMKAAGTEADPAAPKSNEQN